MEVCMRKNFKIFLKENISTIPNFGLEHDRGDVLFWSGNIELRAPTALKFGLEPRTVHVNVGFVFVLRFNMRVQLYMNTILMSHIP